MVNIKEYPYGLRHVIGKEACGEVALYLSEKPCVGDHMKPSTFMLTNGERPTHERHLLCGSCGRPFPVTDITGLQDREVENDKGI